MPGLSKKMAKIGAMVGLDPQKIGLTIKGLPFFVRDCRQLKKQMRDQSFPLGRAFPCLTERFGSSGDGKSIYFLQDLFVAQRVFLSSPMVHVDVGSRIDGFVAHVAAFRKVKVFDIRSQESQIPNVEFVQADMMRELSKELYSCCDSLSSLHAIEHFGLGRYGDPVCWDGHIRGLNNLGHLLRVGGTLYLSVPIGPQRVEFNAHRVFSVRWLLDYFAKSYKIEQFSYIDQGVLHSDVAMDEISVRNNFGCHYGCGIFELTKIRD